MSYCRDFIVSGTDYSTQRYQLLRLYPFPLSPNAVCRCSKAKHLSCQNQAFVSRITFETIVSHHKEYGCNHIASIVLVPALGIRRHRAAEVSLNISGSLKTRVLCSNPSSPHNAACHTINMSSPTGCTPCRQSPCTILCPRRVYLLTLRLKTLVAALDCADVCGGRVRLE